MSTAPVSVEPTIEDSNWRVPVDLSGLRQASTLEDFPVLVRVSEAIAGFDYDDCDPEGHDVVFSDEAGNPLAHEIERWNPSGVSLFWVKAPEILPYGSDTRIWMYWGAPAPSDATNPPAVWSNGYVAVFHGTTRIDPISGETIWIDSTGKFQGIDTSVFNPPESIESDSTGTAMRFDLPKAGLLVSGSETTSFAGPLSFEFRIFDRGAATNQYIMSKGGTKLGIEAPCGTRVIVDYDGNDLEVPFPSFWWDLYQWRTISIRWDGAAASANGLLFTVDGYTTIPRTASATGMRISDFGAPMILGNLSTPVSNVTRVLADLDEFRISTTPRSDAWVIAQYLSQRGTELEFGPVEAIP